MRKAEIALLTLLLTLCAAGSASAQTGYTFAVEVNGGKSAEVEAGASAEVTLRIESPAKGSFDLYGFQDYLYFDPQHWEFEEESLRTSDGVKASFHQAESRVFVNRGSTEAIPIESGTAVVTFRLKALKCGSTAVVSRGQELLSREAEKYPVILSDAVVTIGEPADETPALPPADSHKPPQKVYFRDVPLGAWYGDSVVYCVRRGLMNGTGEGKFSPDGSTSRAMLVTVLFRMDGEPEIENAADFSDVLSGQWYTDAVCWAASLGIVRGYGNSTFGPGDTLTREQLAVILHRYAESRGFAMTVGGDLSRFTDRNRISPYAEDAMTWAVGEGILGGMGDGTLAPRGLASRAQIAAILMRFCESMDK